MIISDKISTFVTFGYLSATTCGMAFGLLCITIAAFVYSLNFICYNIILVLNVWTRSCFERW